ncbi:MAG: dihydroorotase [Synechococcus sp.]
MDPSVLLDPVQILEGPGQSVRSGAVLIDQGRLLGFDDAARQMAQERALRPTPAGHQVLAPCLVDPHSVLEQATGGREETLTSLRRSAAAGGYGQIALLPRSSTWRDRPERLQGFATSCDGVRIHLWGSFSLGGSGTDLAPHADLLEAGAIGLADDDAVVPIPLLEQGLLLGEMSGAPILVAPRDPALQGDGMVREGVETLRAGWSPDPTSSEALPLSALLALQGQHPQRQLRLMNLSTAAAVQQLKRWDRPPRASVSWWHLLRDRSELNSTDPGWRVHPSLGGPADRSSLRDALRSGLISAVAVHAVPLDAEDMLLPADQRPAGLSGHHLVLSALWDALVRQEGWSVEELWQALSFGGSELLDQPSEHLQLESHRWVLFDPDLSWTISCNEASAPLARNLPLQGETMRGKVIASGLEQQMLFSP